jgi:hypothetical protein
LIALCGSCQRTGYMLYSVSTNGTGVSCNPFLYRYLVYDKKSSEKYKHISEHAMSSATLLFVVVFAVCAVNFGIVEACSRSLSRQARNIFLNDIFPSVNIKASDLPESCPLHTDFDMYKSQESNKYMEHSSEWQCKYCGKKFVSEKYIDKHMDNYHRTLIPVRNERII